MEIIKLYKQDESGKVRVWWAEVLGNSYRFVSGQIDGKKITTEWTVAEPKNVGKKNHLHDYQQALIEVEAHYAKKKKRGYTEELEGVEKVKKALVGVMLAHDYEDYKDKIVFPVYSQPKLDGIRCIAREDGLWSRKGEPITTVPHIANIAIQLCKKYKIIIDGELYNHDLRDDFNKICSLVRRQKIDKERIAEVRSIVQYHVYDLLDENTSFIKRVEKLALIVGSSEEVRLVPTAEVYTQVSLDDYYELYVKNGYEGQMVRSDSFYERKRTSALLKRKEFKDEEFLITDIIEGKGNRSGMVGSIVFGNFQASLMGTNEYRKEVLKNKKNYIGKKATVKYFHKTPDGIPRFPVVRAILDD